MNKDQLLQAIEECHEEIETCLDAASDAQLSCCPGPQADWSVKELVAHLTHWEQDMLQRVGNSALGILSDDQVDAVNALCYEQNKDRTLDEIRGDFRRSLEQINEIVGALSDDDLSKSGWSLQDDGAPLWKYIASETYEHYYDDHLSDMQTWARREGVLL
jgi:hypothetical protein